jgi:PAS domain S-box-containing protein
MDTTSADSPGDTGATPLRAAATRPRRRGITARVTAGLVAMAGFVLLSGGLSFVAFTAVEREMTGMTRQTLPRITASAELTGTVQQFLALVPPLAEAGSQAERRVARTALVRQSELIAERRRALSDVSGGDAEMWQRLLTEVETSTTNLQTAVAELDRHVERRIEAQADIATALDALSRLLERAGGEPVIPEGAAGRLAAFERGLATLLADLAEVPRISRLNQIRARRVEAAAALDDLGGIAATLPPDLRTPLTEKVAAMRAVVLGGPTPAAPTSAPATSAAATSAAATSLFDAVEERLQADARATAIRNQTRLLVEGVEYAAREIFRTVNAEARDDGDRIGALLDQERRLVLAIVVISVLLAAGVFGWFRLFLTGRLEALSTAVLARLGGRPATMPVTGNDEITDIGEALSWFVDTISARERALTESERRFRDLVEGALVGIYIHREFEIVFSNDTFARMLGHPSAAALMQQPSLLAAIPEAKWPEARGHYDRLLTGKEVRRHRVHSRRVDGSMIWLDLTERVVDWMGRPAVQCVVADVTREVEAETELARKTTELQAALTAMPSGMLMIDRDLRIQLVNDRALELWDGPPEMLAIGRPITDLARFDSTRGGQDEETTLDRLRRLLEGGSGVVSGERMMANGTILLMQGRRVPDGGAVLTYTDITELKRIQAELLEARDQAEQATRAKSLFLATMSHEIRTPMNGVVAMGDLLQQTMLSKDQATMVRIICESARALLTIINDILDFSKIEAGHLELERVEMNLAEMVEGVGDLLALRAADKGLAFDVFVDPALPDRVLGDPVRLRQVLVNLAGNALKFTEAGRVAVSAEPAEGDRVRFRVSDTGIGLTAEQTARLFQPFAQADASTSRRFGGTGLGLSISRRLVALMDGTIQVDSTLGEGATFEVVVPLPAIPSRGTERPALAGLRVGIATDDPHLTAILSRYLTALEAVPVPLVDPGGADGQPELVPADGPDPDVAVVDAQAWSGAGKDLLVALAGLMPDTVRICLGGGSYGSGTGGATALDTVLARPIRRGRFWRAIAAAGGIPLPQEEEGADSALPTWALPSTEEALAAGALVLIVEDNPTNRVVVRRQLERLGVAADAVGNGEEALAALAEQPYGLLLTDCHMPVMDGYELTRRLRHRERTEGRPRLPVVALTADAIQGTQQRCLDSGMDAYLVKPVDLRELDQAIRTHLPAAAALRRPVGPEATGSEGGTGPVGGNPRHAPAVGEAALSGIDALLDRFVLPIDLAGDTTSDLRVLDLTRLEEVFGTLDERAVEMLDLYRSSTEPLLAALEAALATGDGLAARHAAHAAKGASNGVGAREMGEILGVVEQAARIGDLATATGQIARLTGAWDRFLGRFAQARARYGTAATGVDA